MKTLTTSITKILDLALNEVGYDFKTYLTGWEDYADDKSDMFEHLYSPYNLKELQDFGDLILSNEHSELLDEIFKLCEKKDCAYFRIIS